MNKLITGLFLLILSTGKADAQYYYKDIISSRQVAADLAAYREAKVKKIIIKSFEYTGEPSEDFFCEKHISRDFKKTSLYTRSDASSKSLLETFFDEKGRLIRTFDSSNIVVSSSNYTYDADGRIKSIESFTRSEDDDFINELTEEHLWEYNEQGVPVKMAKVKNRKDTVMILFSMDEQSNPSIEKDTKTGAKYYYYYDAQNRLTDVVHANEYKEKLVVDYLFEYNAAGQITQMTTTEEGKNNFLIWKYTYDNGLRSRERIFTNDRKLLGSIEYEYK
jgi:hypothetical protein